MRCFPHGYRLRTQVRAMQVFTHGSLTWNIPLGRANIAVGSKTCSTNRHLSCDSKHRCRHRLGRSGRWRRAAAMHGATSSRRRSCHTGRELNRRNEVIVAFRQRWLSPMSAFDWPAHLLPACSSAWAARMHHRHGLVV